MNWLTVTRAELAALWRNGMSQREIAALYGVKNNHVAGKIRLFREQDASSFARRIAPMVHPKVGMTPAITARVRQMLKDGMPVRHIARAVHIRDKSIREVREELGIPKAKSSTCFKPKNPTEPKAVVALSQIAEPPKPVVALPIAPPQIAEPPSPPKIVAEPPKPVPKPPQPPKPVVTLSKNGRCEYPLWEGRTKFCECGMPLTCQTRTVVGSIWCAEHKARCTSKTRVMADAAD